MAQAQQIEPFRISVPDAQIADLRQRLVDTRWPDQIPGSGWDYGCDLSWLQDLAAYWADGFDWRAAEVRLNSRDQVVTTIDGQPFRYAKNGYENPNFIAWGGLDGPAQS